MRSFHYEKLKDCKWDSEVLGYIALIHEYKGRHDLFLSQQPMDLERLVEIAKIQSTEASNKIEGIVTTNVRLKQLYADKTTPKTRDEKEILGYRDVLNVIHENSEYISVKSSYVLQLHGMLYRYSEKSIGGKFKNVQNYITEQRSDGSSFVRFTPLAPYETSAAVDAICENYNKAIEEEIVDSLLLIPVFINDFLCIHPFNDGNGRMSRLLTTLLLYRCGYEVGRYVSLESKIERNKGIYYEALQESSEGWHEEKNNPIPFIKYMLGIILAAYRDFEERLYIVGRKQSSGQMVEEAVRRQIGKFTKRAIMELCPTIGRASVENALKILVDEGRIVRHGSGRSVFYTRKEYNG